MEKSKVLFVDDELNVLNSLRRGLMGENYTCIFADSASEALAQLEKHNIAVIVTDMRMPDMDGLALLKIVKEKYPNTIRIVLSGYTQFPQVLATINNGDIFKFITKPWKVEEEFKPVIREAVEYHNLIVGKEEMLKTLEKQNTSIQNILKLMDEKLAKNKKDYANFKKFIVGVFDFIQQEIIKSDQAQANMEYKYSVLSNFCMGALNTFPSEPCKFKVNLLLDEVIKSVHKLSIFKAVNSRVIEDNDFTCFGDFKLIFYIIMFTINYIPYKNADNFLDVETKLQANGHNAEVITSFRSNLFLQELRKVSPGNLEYLEKLINNTAQNHNVKMSISAYQDLIIARFELPLSGDETEKCEVVGRYELSGGN